MGSFVAGRKGVKYALVQRNMPSPYSHTCNVVPNHVADKNKGPKKTYYEKIMGSQMLREESYEDKIGSEHLRSALDGASSMVDLRGEGIFETRMEGLYGFIDIAAPRGCESIIISLKKVIMDLDQLEKSFAALRVLDALVAHTTKPGDEGEKGRADAFVSVFKCDKWAGRLDQILADSRCTERYTDLIHTILGKWATICDTDSRWGERARGIGNARQLKKDVYIKFIKQLAKGGVTIKFPQDAPAYLARGDF